MRFFFFARSIRQPVLIGAVFVSVLLTTAATSSADETKAGRPFKGLQLLIEVTDSWTVGMGATVKATLFNVGDEAYFIDVFGDANRRYLLTEEAPTKEGSPRWMETWRIQLFKGAKVLNLGPSIQLSGKRDFSKDQFIRLVPGEHYSRVLTWPAPLNSPGPLRFHLVYVTDTRALMLAQQSGAVHPTQKVWTGAVVSNVLTVEVGRVVARTGTTSNEQGEHGI